MYYAILCEDVENSLPLRQSARPAHLARLQTLADQGKLLAAGASPDEGIEKRRARYADFPPFRGIDYP